MQPFIDQTKKNYQSGVHHKSFLRLQSTSVFRLFYLFILNINNIFNHAYKEFLLTVVNPRPSSSERREPKQKNRSRCGYIAHLETFENKSEFY